MLTERQQFLIRETIREKTLNLGEIIKQETAKPLRNQNLKQLDRLTAEWHEYNKIYDELLKKPVPSANDTSNWKKTLN